MKSIRIVYWLQIRYIPHLPPQLWVCLMLQQWQRMWIPVKPELQNSSQRLFAMEKEMSHHFLAQSCCCDHWAMAVSCKHHFWADSFAQTLLQEKLLEACSHGAGARLHPKKCKIMNGIFLIYKMNAGCSTHVLLKDSSLLFCLRSFFPKIMLACDNPNIHNMQVNFHEAEENSNTSYWRKLNLIFHSIKTSLHRQDKSHELL